MEDARATAHAPSFARKLRWAAKVSWLVTEHIFDLVADALVEYAHTIMREVELFLGALFVILGLLNFRNGKNCDGNAGDYLSCTHPSTFYYYSWVEVTLVIVGVGFILLWILARRKKSLQP